jgi:hypothetical protein
MTDGKNDEPPITAHRLAQIMADGALYAIYRDRVRPYLEGRVPLAPDQPETPPAPGETPAVPPPGADEPIDWSRVKSPHDWLAIRDRVLAIEARRAASDPRRRR